MTPIEKNVIVVDELGNEYEATYPKRAKGLVKNGRARFIDDNTICLACPPHTELEDKIMTNITARELWDRIVATQDALEKIDALAFKVQSVRECATYVEIEDSEHCGEPLPYFEEVATLKICAIKEMVNEREATLRQLLDFYMRLYDDCIAASADNKKA